MTGSIVRPKTLLEARTHGQGKRTDWKQLLVMQDLMFEAVVNPDVAIDSKPACVRAWDILQERRRIMRGKPLPGVLRPTNTKRGRVVRGNAELKPVAEAEVVTQIETVGTPHVVQEATIVESQS